jgi:plastocyanin
MARRVRPVRLFAGAGFVLALAALAGPVVAATSPVSIVDKTFTPATITVAAGDTVTWTVTKAIDEPHSVTSGKPGAADAGKVFDSKITLAKNGDTFSYTFATTGEYDYYCTVHGAAMSGHVSVVAAAGGGAGASASPASTAGSAASPGASTAASPAASGAEASPGPVVAEHAPVDPTTKLVAGAILIVTLALLFGAAWAYRRANRMA